VANEETGFGTIKCPGCGEAIPISEAIHHQIAERTRQEFKAEALEGKRALAAKERELNEKVAALDQTISKRLAASRTETAAYPMIHRIIMALLVFISLSESRMASAQFVTANTLQRVKKIQIGPTIGTAFSMEVDGRQYLITAKHVTATVKGDDAEIRLFEGKGKYDTLKIKVLRCADPVDIAILIPNKQVTIALPLPPSGGNVVFSQEVFFVGFPFGDDTLNTYLEETAVGFIRKATMSAQERRDGWILYFLDGINNQGFSGSPVVFQDMNDPSRPWKILGVISGYRPDPTEVMRILKIRPEDVTAEDEAAGRIVRFPDGRVARLVPSGDVVLNNSGIVRAYGIQSAIELIRKSGAQGPEIK
jgi:hypothetical protein